MPEGYNPVRIPDEAPQAAESQAVAAEHQEQQSRFGLPQDSDLLVQHRDGRVDGGWYVTDRKDITAPDGTVIDIAKVRKIVDHKDGKTYYADKVVSTSDLLAWQTPPADEAPAVEQPEESQEAEPHSFAVLAKDPNKLLDARTLHTVITDPNRLLPEGSHDNEARDTVQAMKKYAEREIVAPEAAAQISKEYVDRSMTEAQKQAAEANRTLNDVESKISTIEGVGTNLDQQLNELRMAIGNLENNLDQNFRYLDEGQVRYFAGVIREFDGRYQDMMGRRTQALEGATETSSKVGVSVETGANTHEGARQQHQNLTNEAFTNPAGVDPEDVSRAVAERGAQDINEHKNGAVKDIDRDMQTMQTAARVYGAVSGDVRGMTNRMLMWDKEGHSTYPHPEQVSPVIDAINHEFNKLFQGGGMPNKYRLQEMFQILQERVGKIQQASHIDQGFARDARADIIKIRANLLKLSERTDQSR